MNITCLIDSLGSGGAQRQLTTLAVGLKARGHDVRFLVYHDESHFLPVLQEAGIACDYIPPCSYVRRAWAVRKILRRGRQDVVIAFLEASSLYAELACVPKRTWGLVVGERLASPGMLRGIGALLRQGHRVADRIVCNSHANRLMLCAAMPSLKERVSTVDFSVFHPSEVTSSLCDRPIRIVVAANYHAKKNMMNVARALLSLKKRAYRCPVVIDWFGKVQPEDRPFREAEAFVRGNGLNDLLRFHPTACDISREYADADAIGLFSLYEGLPNVVCEGMACGKPILMSNVCDAGNLVRDGVNGFLCDPLSPEDISHKIELFANVAVGERTRMGQESLAIAKVLFDEEKVLQSYEEVLNAAASRRVSGEIPSWPEHVPDSARREIRLSPL